MTIDAKLFSLLACPACKGSLDHVPEPESLACAACKKRYPFEDGIPVLLADRAKPL